ncbi:hypothetical protein [Mucilaginibacter gynuensis]
MDRTILASPVSKQLRAKAGITVKAMSVMAGIVNLLHVGMDGASGQKFQL